MRPPHQHQNPLPRHQPDPQIRNQNQAAGSHQLNRDIRSPEVKAAAMKETDRLQKTVTKWWPEIQTLLATRVTTAKVEAANTMIKNIKRIARGFRNPINYQSRILLRSAARTVA
ncbi:hypothetical protein CVS29_18030 [Arthrobacter psychrochitiniphilus]|uniref:Transposase IS204/IS1001/IS1096/IS1165 DDE domain-containing protein n=1 Tax=Arthrobacter psychrochitiniphilus TaxID=291045 RepID=A0A2V3DNV7_9MICC|nr:hypothetical protein CVS29_18030 [Arthrobacter psychrochitiniphilus]